MALDGISRDDRAQGGKMTGPGDTHVFVDGLVAARDLEPYVRLVVNGEKAQLTIAEAHKVVLDLMKIAARTEADAMVLRFFSERQFPEGAGAAIMQEFRYFRQRQDDKPIEQMTVDPDSGEKIK
jgi:hypothetical protein